MAGEPQHGMAGETQHAEEAPATQLGGPGDVVVVQLRLPDGSTALGHFQEGDPAADLARLALTTDWAKKCRPAGVDLSLAFPRRSLAPGDVVGREFHHSVVNVASSGGASSLAAWLKGARAEAPAPPPEAPAPPPAPPPAGGGEEEEPGPEPPKKEARVTWSESSEQVEALMTCTGASREAAREALQASSSPDAAAALLLEAQSAAGSVLRELRAQSCRPAPGQPTRVPGRATAPGAPRPAVPLSALRGQPPPQAWSAVQAALRSSLLQSDLASHQPGAGAAEDACLSFLKGGLLGALSALAIGVCGSVMF